MQNLFDTPIVWVSVLVWIGIAALVALAIWTFVRAPGRRQDPGLPGHRPDAQGGDGREPLDGPAGDSTTPGEGSAT